MSGEVVRNEVRAPIQFIDTSIKIETPEGIDLELQVAGPLVRAVALLIDGLIKLVIQVLAYFLLSRLGEAGAGLIMLVLFLMEWFYPVLFEVLWHGQTPGKQALNIRVIHDDGSPISWGASMLRNLIRFVDFLPMGYMTGAITMVMAKRFKRLGDLVAGTLVIYATPFKVERKPRVKSSGSTPLEPLAPPLPLTNEEQLAVMAFADRAEQLSQARAQEVANLLSPVLLCRDQQAVVQLKRVAAWLRGGGTV